MNKADKQYVDDRVQQVANHANNLWSRIDSLEGTRRTQEYKEKTRQESWQLARCLIGSGSSIVVGIYLLYKLLESCGCIK